MVPRLNWRKHPTDPTAAGGGVERIQSTLLKREIVRQLQSDNTDEGRREEIETGGEKGEIAVLRSRSSTSALNSTTHPALMNVSQEGRKEYEHRFLFPVIKGK